MRCLLILFTLTCLVFGKLPAQTEISFLLAASPPPDNPELVGPRGSYPPLCWEKTFPVSKEDGKYTITLLFAQTSQILEFKFVYCNPADGQVNWEGIDNRSIVLTAGCAISRSLRNSTRM